MSLTDDELDQLVERLSAPIPYGLGDQVRWDGAKAVTELRTALTIEKFHYGNALALYQQAIKQVDL